MLFFFVFIPEIIQKFPPRYVNSIVEGRKDNSYLLQEDHEKLLESRKVIIFGASERGQSLYYILDKLGVRVSYFVDKNRTLFLSSDVEIKSPKSDKEVTYVFITVVRDRDRVVALSKELFCNAIIDCV